MAALLNNQSNDIPCMYLINYKFIILVHVIVNLVQSLLNVLYCEGMNSRTEFVIGTLECLCYLQHI